VGKANHVVRSYRLVIGHNHGIQEHLTHPVRLLKAPGRAFAKGIALLEELGDVALLLGRDGSRREPLA
jgi:hypothetical protein